MSFNLPSMSLVGRKQAESDEEQFQDAVDTLQEQAEKRVDVFGKTDFLKMLKEYLEDNVPDSEEYRELAQFFAVTSKSAKLSFLNERDVETFMLKFEVCKLDYLMHKPPHAYTFLNQQMLDQLDMLFHFNVRRCVGTDKQVINERIAEVAQVVQTISSPQSGERKRPGILSRVAGMI